MDNKAVKTSLILSVVCLLVALIALSAVTYAWFTFDPYTNVTPYEGKIAKGDTSLLISNKPDADFGKSCKLTPEHMGKLLYPISTENLDDFFVATYQEEGISKLFAQVSKDEKWKQENYLIHGKLYLKASGGGADVYFDKPPLDFGAEAQWLAAGRLGLKITGSDKKTKTMIFTLDDMGGTGEIKEKVTIAPPADKKDKALVISKIDQSGAPTFADDPAVRLNSCIMGAGGAKPLLTLNAEEVATVEYWLYLEGCDKNCINEVQTKSVALQFGFAGNAK